MATSFLSSRQSALTAFVSFVICIALFTKSGEASPLAALRALQKRYVQNWQYPGGSGATPYDTQAGAQTRIQFPNGTPPQNFVFFTEIGQFTSDQAVYDFAHANGGIAIRDAYPPNYICRLPDNQVQGGADENNRYWWQFGDMVSGVWADLIGPHANNNNVFLMVNEETFNRGTLARAGGPNGEAHGATTFFRVEAPTLRTYGVTQVTWVNMADFSKTKKHDLPKDPKGPAPTKKRGLFSGLSKRNGKGNEPNVPISMNWDGYGDIPGAGCPNENPEPLYSSGQCGVHISQDTSIDSVFGMNVTIKDSNGEEIGNGSENLFPMERWDFPSELPYTVALTPGFKKGDPVLFQYAGFTIPTVAPACSVGKYDHNVRQMDCGFPCR